MVSLKQLKLKISNKIKTRKLKLTIPTRLNFHLVNQAKFSQKSNFKISTKSKTKLTKIHYK